MSQMLREVSQEELVAEWLRQGNSITPLEALSRFGCLRLGARIYRLRKAGMDIVKETVKTSTGAYVARYRLNQ